MKNNRKLAFTFLFIVLNMLSAIVASASRPSRSEGIRNMSSRTVTALGQAIDKLSAEQISKMTGMPSGVKLVDGKVLKYLMEHDEKADKNEVYDSVLKLELETPPCRYYLVFNPAVNVMTRSFCLLDTTFGDIYEALDEKFRRRNPRELFKEICTLFRVDEYYEKYNTEFIEETQQKKNLKSAKMNDTGMLGFLARYWWSLILFAFLDFYFVDLKLMKNERMPVKLYAMGLHIVCMVLGLTIVTISFTGTPAPDLRTFARLIDGSYPKELYNLSDIILVTSFAWWPISIVAVFMAGSFNWSPLIPLLYVIAGPLAFAMSESPVGGPQKLALPVAGLLIMLINAIYIKKKYSKTHNPDA